MLGFTQEGSHTRRVQRDSRPPQQVHSCWSDGSGAVISLTGRHSCPMQLKVVLHLLFVSFKFREMYTYVYIHIYTTLPKPP